MQTWAHFLFSSASVTRALLHPGRQTAFGNDHMAIAASESPQVQWDRCITARLQSSNKGQQAARETPPAAAAAKMFSEPLGGARAQTFREVQLKQVWNATAEFDTHLQSW
ncbi:uncharacterized protein BKA78DRAFT_363533 [Phyllosticta capitalensis]|uniref:uncharacterized protein n=1 Tax=Phyllosticta capitalensis TaxID=121624 RepID=UPI003131E854